MRSRDVLSMALKNLWRRKLRSFLTILGVLVGVTSIVVMVSLGVGLNKQSMATMDASDSLTRVDVSEQYQGMSQPGQGTGSTEKIRLTKETVEDLALIPGVKAAYPIREVSLQAKSGAYESHLQIMGIPTGYLAEQKLNVGEGRLYDPKSQTLELYAGPEVPGAFWNPNGTANPFEPGAEANVNLIKDSVFGTWEDVGGSTSETQAAPKKEILKFVGVGKMEEGSMHYSEMNYKVITDLDMLEQHLQRVYRGKALPGQPTNKNGKPTGPVAYSKVVLRLKSIDDAQPVIQAVRDLGLMASSETEYIETMQKEATRVQFLFGGIGAVSLFVAAIGIMNTMMMSIYERTKEIGVFKVLGCDISRIRDLFLCEAALIGFVGGIFGLVVSFSVSHIINKVSSGGAMMNQGGLSVIPPWLAGLSLIFAILVGAFSGLLPALRAMRLSPLQALRNE